MEDLAAASKEVLVHIVKQIQKQGMRGEKGGWKDFLKFYDKQLGDSVSDPARRSVDVLQAFIKTFKEESDLKLIADVMKGYSNHEIAKQSLISKENVSPEKRLVRLTHGHPLYLIDYSFPTRDKDWVVTALSEKNKDKLLAVDCEMVLCEDGSEALAKICVVDRKLNVKIHEFVNPCKVVVDYKTSITGVTAEDLSQATFTLPHIQKSLTKLLSHGAILVGHSLSNDLKALKLDHTRVIDTSFIFKYGDECTKRRPSLNDLCKSVLGHEVRKQDAPHNCKDDACAAMKLVLAKIEKGFDDVLPMIQDNNVPVPDIRLNQLLIHRIPMSMPSEDLHKIIDGEFKVEVKKNKNGRGERYSAIVIFKSPEEAFQIFENIAADEVKDPAGLPQKKISIKLSSGETDMIYARKMSSDSALVSNKKRPCPSEEISSEQNKVLKMDQTIDVSMKTACVEHVKEINWLKSVISKRDEEISSLHKIIAALTRKQGL